jgi:hypothetical protein
MKLIDILNILDEKTKIKLFIDDEKIGIIYLSPLRTSLINKFYYNITKIYIDNNILIIELESVITQQNTLINNCKPKLFDVLSFIKNKNHLKIFFNNELISYYQYLYNTINKMFIKNNILNILLC